MDALRLTILTDSARKGIAATLAQILVDQEATRQECMVSDQTLSLTVAALQDQANATKDPAIIALGHDIKRQLTVGIHKRLTRAETNIKYVELLQKHIDAGKTVSSHFKVEADGSYPILFTNTEQAIGTVAHTWKLETTQLKTELASAKERTFLLPLPSENEDAYARRIGAIAAAATTPALAISGKYLHALFRYMSSGPPSTSGSAGHHSPTGSAKSKGSKAGSKHSKTTTDDDDPEEEEEEEEDKDDYIQLLQAHIEKLTDWGLKIQQAARDMYPTYAREKQFFGDTWQIAGGPVTKLPAVLKTKLVRTPTAAEGSELVDEDGAKERAMPRRGSDSDSYSSSRPHADIVWSRRGGAPVRPKDEAEIRRDLFEVDDTYELRPRGRRSSFDDMQMEESRGSAEYTRPRDEPNDLLDDSWIPEMKRTVDSITALCIQPYPPPLRMRISEKNTAILEIVENVVQGNPGASNRTIASKIIKTIIVNATEDVTEIYRLEFQDDIEGAY